MIDEPDDAVGIVARYAARRIRPVGRSFARALLIHARGSLEDALDLVDALAGQIAIRRYSRERGATRLLRQIERDGDPARRFVPSRAPLRVIHLHAGQLFAVEVQTP